MKKLYILTMLLLMSVATFAQSQDYMSYQAVIRNASNNLITNQPVGMKISILQGSAIGTAVYEETQTPTSNINGLVTLVIGGGSTISGSYGTINWANGPYFIKTETDPTGGTNYTIVGVTQFLSVPYALYAANSGSSIPGPQGPAGLNGVDGINGLDGATGPMGPQGPAGLNGTDGINGLDGATGPMGPQGPAGLNGTDGINGLDGATGPMGPQGPAGLNGTDGINGLDGATGPMGPQGPAGNNGLDGATGPMGPQGPAGNNGLDGINGLDGATGPMGPQGPAGNDGLDGATGPMGPQGPAGNNGLDGATGPMGPQGPQGLQGPAGSPATLAFSFMSKTFDYTITASDVTNNLIVKNSSNSVVTFTLPSASAAGVGKMIYITSTSTSTPQSINVLTDGSDLFFGFYTTPSGTTDISATTLSNIGWVQLISDGTSWNILGMYW